MASTSEKSSAAKQRAIEKAARKAEKKLQAQQAAAAAAAAQQQQQLEQQSNNNHQQNNGIKVVHEEQILEAIDQLRRRKARPDADRICNYLLRKFSVDARDTIADLHRLIEAEKVIQVDYKGNTSYRNASKWTRLQLYKNRPEGFVKEKINSNMIAGAFAELVVEEPDYLDQGVPAFRLVEQLLEGVSNPTSRRMVEDFLGKEVASGNLTRLSNGNYSLVDSNMNGNGSNSTLQQNGDVIKSKSSSTSTAFSTPVKECSNDIYDISDFGGDEHDSSSNTIKSSRQTSPKSELEPMKKEDCYEIIVGRRHINDEDDNKSKDSNGKYDHVNQKEDNVKKNGRTSSSPSGEKEELKNSTEIQQSSHRKSKTERKQRLCVRSDDSSDLLFKYEDYRKESSYKDEQDKRDDGNDRISDDGDGDMDAGRSSTNPSPTPSHNNAGNFRSARRKRAKKVFDPSDNMVVKRKRGRMSNAAKALAAAQLEAQDAAKASLVKEIPKDPNRHCSLCSKDKQETLTACRDCTVRAHPSCIYSPEEMVLKAHTSWQCDRCKTCLVCYETSEAGPLITCFSCDDAYHYSCHSPRIPSAKTKWYCNDCNQKQFKPSPPTQNSNSNWTNNSLEQKSNDSIIPPVLSPQVSPARNTSDHMDEDISKEAIDPNIPDASDWTSEQVYQYFARLFPKEAEIFRLQEIDGHSLLLLKRSDVLGGLDLLLGPALKIYRHVLKLQVRRDDPKLYWL